jgi:hypothetical protein
VPAPVFVEYPYYLLELRMQCRLAALDLNPFPLPVLRQAFGDKPADLFRRHVIGRGRLARTGRAITVNASKVAVEGNIDQDPFMGWTVRRARTPCALAFPFVMRAKHMQRQRFQPLAPVQRKATNRIEIKRAQAHDFTS